MLKKIPVIAAIYLLLLPQLLLGSPMNQAAAGPRVFKESFVIKTMVSLVGAQATFQSTSDHGTFGSLAQLRQAELIDEALASGNKYGYVFTVSVTPNTGKSTATFTVTATPQRYRKTGVRSFFVNESGEVRGADKNGEPATQGDPLIETCSLWGMTDNERCTMLSLRTLVGAQATFQSSSPINSFGSLADLYQAGLISRQLFFGTAHEYLFTMVTYAPSPAGPSTFTVSAIPRVYGTTGIRSFFIDQTGVLRGADKNGQPADVNDPPINE